MVPGERELHRGVGGQVGFPGVLVHGGCGGEEGVDIEALEGEGDEAHGGHDGGAATHPILHWETGDPVIGFRVVIEIGAVTRDGYRVRAELKPGRIIGRFGFQHPIAGLRGAAGL